MRRKIGTVLLYAICAFIVTLALVMGNDAGWLDSRVYFNASHGDLSGKVVYTREGIACYMGWIYADPVRYLFSWMFYFKFSIVSAFWFVTQSFAFVYLSLRLYRAVGIYALGIISLLYWPFSWMLGGSNVQITLLVLALNPFTLPIACFVKPQFALFALVFAFAQTRAVGGDQKIQRYRRRLDAAIHPRDHHSRGISQKNIGGA